MILIVKFMPTLNKLIMMIMIERSSRERERERERERRERERETERQREDIRNNRSLCTLVHFQCENFIN